MDYTGQMSISESRGALAVDNQYLVVGLSQEGEGGAKVIDLATQEVVAYLPHQDSEDREVVKVMITRSWIITQSREKALLWSRETFQKVLTLDLPIRHFSTLLSMETEGGDLYLIFHQLTRAKTHPLYNPLVSLYKLNIKPDSDDQEITLELIFERKRDLFSKFGSSQDTTPVLVNKKRLKKRKGKKLFPAFLFHIDQIHKNDGQVRTTNLPNIALEESDLEVIDCYFSSPYLAVLIFDLENPCEQDYSKLILKVWNIERSPSRPLYSIDVDEVDSNIDWITNVSLQLQNNLIRISRPGKICVFDARNIEDRDSVLKSRREFTVDVGEKETLILFNKFLGASKQQDSITFYNFWK